ncbi:MAG: hypothetical protein WAN46_13355 [Gammaproteobacteria bacterium]
MMNVIIEPNSGIKSALPKFVLAIALVAVMAYTVSYLFAVSPIMVRVLGTLLSAS